MKKKDLIKLAKKNEIELSGDETVADLNELLEAAEVSTDDAPRNFRGNIISPSAADRSAELAKR